MLLYDLDYFLLVVTSGIGAMTYLLSLYFGVIFLVMSGLLQLSSSGSGRPVPGRGGGSAK